MSRPILLAILGGAAAGGIWLLARSKPSAAQPPYALPPPPVPPKAEQEVQQLAAQVKAENEKQEALRTQLANLDAAAKGAKDPAQKKLLENAKAQLAAAAAQGAAKTTALKADLAAKAQVAVTAAKAAEAAAAKGPLYPVGLDIRFGKRQATITEAHQDAQGNWHYTANVKSGELWGLGSGSYQFDEPTLRSKVQSEVGPIQPGQAFVAGVTVYRKGQGGLIERAEKNAAGEWAYAVRGWPNIVTQSELLGILTRA